LNREREFGRGSDAPVADRRLANRQLWTCAVVIGALTLLANVWSMLTKQVERQLSANWALAMDGATAFG